MGHSETKRPSAKYLLLFAVLAATALLTVARISGTSIGMYSVLFNGKEFHDPNLLFGQPRAIRSDEWRVQTPWTAAQSQTGFQLENTLYVPRQNLITMNVPVASWVMVFRPWLWPFFVFPLEYGFALSWWIHSVMLLLVTYALLMRLTKQDVFVSVLGALAFLYSPYFQWWYSALVDVTSCGLLTFFFATQLFQETRIVRMAIYSILLAYFGLCFALILYPPAQIPIAWALLFIGTGAVLAQRGRLNRINIRKMAPAFLVAGAAMIVVLVVFYLDFKGIITAIQNTVYPGARRALGGKVTPLQLVGGFLDIFLLHSGPPSILGPNESEAASFFLLSIFLVPLFLFGMARAWIMEKEADTTLLAVTVFYLLALSWMVLGLPAPLAKVLLLQFVPPVRTWIAVGLLNLFLIYYYLCRYKIEITLDFKIFAWLSSATLFFIVLYVGHALSARSRTFVRSNAEVVAIAAVSALLLLLLLLKRKREFAVLLLLFTLASTFAVNPLYRGLSPLLNSDLSAAMRRLNARDTSGAVWIMFGSNLGNYLPANGIQSLGGVYSYPDVQFWRQFDPAGRYGRIYNRYSHTVFATAPAGDTVKFLLPFPDVVQVKIDPCDPALQKLDVNYFIFVEPANAACLRQVEVVNYPDMRFYIYRRME